VKKPYHIVTRAARESAAVIEQFCQSNGQILLPIVHLIESASQVVETVLHEIQVYSLEAILGLSAEQLAGARTPGKARGDIRHHGSQADRVQLADRKIKLKRPRLRHKSEGEVKIPAYEALRQDRGLSQHMLGALLRGISTREYQEVLPQMAATVGVSKSAISRQAIEASAEQLQQLRERRWDKIEILVIYIDGQRFAAHHMLSAVGVDVEGHKHILGIEAGATENAAAVKSLLTGLRDRGLPTDRKYLFVIDGAKALRAAIEEVFGDDQPIQRCRNHKLDNVMLEPSRYDRLVSVLDWEMSAVGDPLVDLERPFRCDVRPNERIEQFLCWAVTPCERRSPSARDRETNTRCTVLGVRHEHHIVNGGGWRLLKGNTRWRSTAEFGHPGAAEQSR